MFISFLIALLFCFCFFTILFTYDLLTFADSFSILTFSLALISGTLFFYLFFKVLAEPNLINQVFYIS